MKTRFQKLNDPAIREAAKSKLLQPYLKATRYRLVEELTVGRGRSRVDMALIGPLLLGFEIKSDGDSLERLPEQAKYFSAVFDKVTLLVGYRLAYDALQMVPRWWGVKLVHVGDHGAVHFDAARDSQLNPDHDNLSLAALLWRNEALELLEQLGQADGVRSKSRSEIYEKLSRVAGSQLLKRTVRRQLLVRRAPQAVV